MSHSELKNLQLELWLEPLFAQLIEHTSCIYNFLPLSNQAVETGRKKKKEQSHAQS